MSLSAINPGEQPLIVFISSVMNPELQWAREATRQVIGSAPFLSPWLFEYTPASSEAPEETYLSKVSGADFVIWLVGEDTTDPVRNEIREAIAGNRRLLVMKLPAERRSEATERLITEVGQRAKWADVRERGELGHHVQLAIYDEVVRAVRQKPAAGRLALLEEMGRNSRARCVARWQGAGVAWAEAANLADDPEVYVRVGGLAEGSSTSVVVLRGELGSGKSLILERILQRSIAKARRDGAAPIPVYIDAQSCVGRLRREVTGIASPLGDPSVQGAAIIIDGVDEAGAGLAGLLLEEARILAGTWPGTRVVMASRPVSALTLAEEKVDVPPLSEPQCLELISRTAGFQVDNRYFYTWPKSICEAVKRPLFAILIGVHLRSNSDSRGPSSTGELISELVDRALRKQHGDTERMMSDLRRLGALSTDRGGGPVPLCEVTAGPDQQRLIDSGLVVQQGNALALALPVLTQWFAAQSLVAGPRDAQSLDEDPMLLENWRYPLVVFMATQSHEAVSKVVRPIAESDPGFVSEIIDDALSHWGLGGEIPAPPGYECGLRIRESMCSWAKGLGPLASLIAPVRDDGRLRPLRVWVDGAWLEAAWYDGGDDPCDITVARPDLSADWPSVQGARPGRQSAWAWRWTRDYLSGRLSELLAHRLLTIPEGPLALEEAWCTALKVCHRGSLDQRPIPIQQLAQNLSEIPANSELWALGERVPIRQLNLLRKEVQRLSALNGQEMKVPWPSSDTNYGGGRTSDFYTPERMLCRATVVYSAAIEGYLQIVNKWFPSIARRMATAAIQPAKLDGVLIARDKTNWHPGSIPGLEWFWDALPASEPPQVAIRLGEHDIGRLHGLRASGASRVRALRPEAAPWLPVTFHQAVLDIFQPDSAQRIAYDWLHDDLRRIHWVS